MRTKHFLTALCLPLAFAACTNDDFVNESNNMLGGREMIDVTLTATKPSFGADTRMSINDKNQFLWEKDVDMIGAALVDGKINNEGEGEIDGNIYVNYPFTADADGNVSTFSGKSAMTQGKYFFYYEYQDVLNRKGLPMGKPNQVYDATSEKTALQQAAKYMRMVSPIVDLGGGLKYEDAQTYNLNLKFANLYTIVQVNIKSANIREGVAPKVTKIRLDGKKSKNGLSEFYVNAAVDMAKVASAGIITLDKGQIKAAEQEAALAELEKMIASDGAIYKSTQADGETDANKEAFELNVKGDVVLDAAKATSLYILVPKGTYAQLDLEVETSEGIYKRKIESTDGIELADKIQPVSAELDFAQDGTGNVSLPNEFKIASGEDWASAVKFMTEHALGYLNNNASFILTEDTVTIESLPTFSLTISSSSKVKKLTLKKNYTISENNAGQFKFNKVNLAVADGATLTLKAGPTTYNDFVPAFINYGTLDVSAKTLSNAIENFGTLNITENAEISGGLTNGQVEDRNKKLPAYVGTVNVAKGKALTIKTKALTNENGTVAIAEDAKLQIENGEDVESMNKADGKIEVKGILKTTGNALRNTGTIDNFGSLQAAVDNESKDKTNKGLIIIEKGSSAAGAGDNDPAIAGGKVEVKDVTEFAEEQANGNPNIKYYFSANNSPTVTARVANKKEFDAAVTSEVITDITLAGGEWTLAATADGAETGKTVALPSNNEAVKGLTLEGATLDVTVNNLDENISTSGTAASKVKTTMTSVTINGNVTVGKGSTLVVEKGVKVNAKTSNNDKVATIAGTLNVMAGVEMYFKTAIVDKNANLNVMGNTKDVSDPGKFIVSNAAEDEEGFINKGTVKSEAGSYATPAAGVVTQPKAGYDGITSGKTVAAENF